METSQLPGFLRIPREVRNQIYGYLLKPRHSQTAFQLTFPPSVLLINHQIHNEASEALYSSNEFKIEIDWISPDMQNSLACLATSRYLTLVRSYSIKICLSFVGQYYLDSDPPAARKRTRRCLQTVCKLLADGPRLRHVTLSVMDCSHEEDWEDQKRVLEPLRLLRSHVDRVDLDTKYTFQEIPMRVVTDVRRQTEADLRTQLETYLMEMAALMEGPEPIHSSFP